MKKITYKFYESGVIPGVPRELGGVGYAGVEIDIDDDTGEVIEIRHPKAPLIEAEKTDNNIQELSSQE